jgi:hypothetical protein
VKRISRLRPDPNLRTALAFALTALCAATGCERPQVLKLHYLNGFVPGSHAIFHSATIAVPPPTSEFAQGIHDVGAIYEASGDLQRQLAVADVGAIVQDAIATALADAGLRPIKLESQPAPRDLKPGVDLMLVSTIEEVSVVKRFGAEKTVHGQVFTMESRVRLKFALLSRDGEKLYEGEMLGTEEEPPAPVGGEIFLPLETQPAEALSVALSRAVGNLLLQPGLRSALPMHAAAASSTPAIR